MGEVFCGEVSIKERKDTDKSKSSVDDNSSESASGTPLGETNDEFETDKEAYSTDNGIVATDDDKEEVERKVEKPKSKNASKIPRIIVTDDDRRSEDVENELEIKSNDM